MEPLFHAIDGAIVLVGYAPDGDSIRFVPDNARRLASLRRSALIRTSAADGSVQLRLEGIDAPELHYEEEAQPFGIASRDALLDWLGASGIRYAADGVTIASASGACVPATIYANAVDTHGRPIAYLARPRANARARASRRARVTADVLRATANYAMLAAGHAYPHVHRRILRGASRSARARALGVWRDDQTARGFALHGVRSLGPRGALVFPKLFRRCVDYLARRRAYGFGGSFVEWLAGHGSHASAVPDRVVLPHAANVPLSSLVRERHAHIALTADVLDLVFVES